MKLVIEINLDNDAMQTGRDVADALGKLAHHVEDNTLPLAPEDGVIRDLNGNTVGRWQVTA
jgi:hypothetical protein